MNNSILAIIGSAGADSSNLYLVNWIASLSKEEFDFTIFDSLKSLPHFDPELSVYNPPKEIIHLREMITSADGILISTPEYVYSIPAGLKNAIEWCIATTVFTDKPCGLITASASGIKGHEQLQLIMKTAMAKVTAETTLLIQGVKGKMTSEGKITDSKTIDSVSTFYKHFKMLVYETLKRSS
jgi:chromate reductase, NAD(P)H dehydrogenase (quinone)